MPFFCSRIQSRILWWIYLSYLLQSLSLVTLGFLKTTGQYFVKCPSIWVYHDFSWLAQGYAFREECYESDVVYLVHDIWEYIMSVSYNLTKFLSVTNKYLGEDTLRLCKYLLFSLNFHPLILIGLSYQQ